MLPGRRDRPLAPHLPLHMARQLVLGNKGAATEGTADLSEIGWLMCLMKEWLHPGKGRPPLEVLAWGEFHWCKVESTSDDSTFAWSWWQKVVTMPSLHSFTLSVTKSTTGTILPLIFWPLPEMNSTPACPHID